MAIQIDGTYSIVASAIAGSSLGVATIVDGNLVANDSAGARYSGRVEPTQDGQISFDLALSLPPKTFGVWGTSPSETVQTRTLQVVLPASVFDGVPFTIPGYDIIVIFRRVASDFAPMAGPQGLGLLIGMLQEIKDSWDRYDSQSR